MKNSEKLAKMLDPVPPGFLKAGLALTERLTHANRSFPSEEFRFENSKTGVSLRIMCGETVESLTCFIFRADRGLLDVNQYFERHDRRDEFLKMFFYPSLEEQLKNLDLLVGTEFLDIFAGQRWEDIPFDWGNYK